MQGGQRSLVELFRNPVMRAGRFLDACAWRLGCFLPDRRLPTPRTGSVRPWGYPGRGLLTTPSRGYPQIQPPPQDPCSCWVPPSASNHLQPRAVARFCTPFIDLGGGSTSMPHFYASHPRFWGSQAGHSRAPPGRPLSRRGRGAALPPGGTAPAAARSCLASSLHFHHYFYYFYPMAQPRPRGSCSQCALGAAGGGLGLLEQEGLRARSCRTPCLKHQDLGYQKTLPKSHLS